MKRVFQVGVAGSDPTLPDVAITLNGGEEMQLVFDLAAISQVEKLTGLNLLECSIGSPTFETVAALLFAALQRSQDDGLTLAEVSSWINLGNIFTFLAAVRCAWGASVPDEKDGETDDYLTGKRRLRQTKPEPDPVRDVGSGSLRPGALL